MELPRPRLKNVSTPRFELQNGSHLYPSASLAFVLTANMTIKTKHKPGYLYRFHRHRPEPTEPLAVESPHVSPRTLVPRIMENGQPIRSAHYYPPTWQSHPMLPPGTLDRDSSSRLNTPPISQDHSDTLIHLPRIEIQQPTPRSGMTVDSKASARMMEHPRTMEPHELTNAQQHGHNNEGHCCHLPHWMCCFAERADNAVHP